MGQVHLEVGIQICLLFVTGIQCSSNCKHMGKEFMVLIPPVQDRTNIVIIGPAEINLTPYGQMSIRKTNESPITTSYTIDKPAAANEKLTGSNIRVLGIRASKTVNVYVQSSLGGAFTALRRPAHSLRHEGFAIATTDPGPTCSTYIAVVAYENDVAISGTVRGKNAEAFFEQSNQTLSTGEEFQNGRIEKRGEAFLITSNKDLSGTFIEADKPVAVYAGVECGTVGSRVISKTIQIAHITQLSKSYVSVSILHDSFTNATFKEITSHGERKDIGPKAEQKQRKVKPWGIVVQTVHVNMTYAHGSQNTVLQTIFNMHPKVNYSLVAFDGFKTTILIVQKQCGDCVHSIQLDHVDIKRSELLVLLNTSTALAFQTQVEPGVHFLQSSTKFTLHAFGIRQASVYSYDAPCVFYNFTGRKLTPATVNATEVSVTTSSGMSPVTTEGNESVVTTTGGPSSGTTEGDESVVTTASGMSFITTESDDSVVTTTSGMSLVTKGGAVTTTERGMSSVTMNVDVTSSTRETNVSSTTTATELIPETSTRSTDSPGHSQAGSPSRPTSAHDTTAPNMTSPGANTPRICPKRSCVCRRVSNTSGIEELKAHLAIDTRNVGARFRSKNSIQDNRPFATALGYVGTIIIFSPLIIIVVLDMRRLFAALMGLLAIED